MSDDRAEWLESLEPEHVDAIGNYTRAKLAGSDAALADPTCGRLGEERGAVFLGLRTGGTIVFGQWVSAENQQLALDRAIENAREKLDASALGAVETAEICLTYDYRRYNLQSKEDRRQLMSNVFRGVRGVEVGFSGKFHYLGPTVMLEQNLGWKDGLELMRKQIGISTETFESRQVTIRQFQSAQVLVHTKSDRNVSLFRGFRVIPVSEVNRENIEKLQQVLGDFLYNNVDEDGRLVYIYDPGVGQEADMPNNMIRQWMATIAMTRTGHYRDGDEQAYATAERNVRHNLRNFYRATGSLGLIEYGNMVKLGAVALAAISLVEQPKRKEFARPERKLYALIDHLWQSDGRFKTFYKPANRDMAHNFYPGEAVLAWSYHLEEKLEPKLLDKFMKSFRYYRKWHLENRNPAFIPWHTQGLYKVWRKTKDKEIVDWIFEMNDWLITEMQQWDEVLFPDAMGRFFNPKKKYGPPHASSTGVYMEGLIDAFLLARELGDTERQERYRISLIRGLRSCMQLTYWNEDDMFYVKDQHKTRGGVRTTVYNTRIRVDNVQHNLMAILKVLENFEDSDFEHP